MRERTRLDQFLVHISLERQPLHVDIMTQGDEALAPVVRLVIGVLHHAQDLEDVLVLFHEELAGKREILRASRFQRRLRRRRGRAAARHGIVDALPGRGGDDARRVAGEHDVLAVVPLVERLERNRRAFLPDGLAVGEARDHPQIGRRLLQVEPVDAGPHADRRGLSVREDPSVEVGRYLPVVDHVAACGVVGPRIQRLAIASVTIGGLDDLVVGDDVGDLVAARHLLPPHLRPGPVGADHVCRREPCFVAAGLVAVDDVGAVRVALDALEGAGVAVRPGPGGAFPQELVEMLPVHHADEAAFYRDVHLPLGRRDHPRGVDLGHELVFGDVEVRDEPRRDRTAARLYPTRAVDEGDLSAPAREILCRCGPRRAASDDDDIVMHVHSPGTRWRGRDRSGERSMMRRAIAAAARKRVASAMKTMPNAEGSETTARIASTAAAPSSPPKPAAIACAAPQRPMRVPSRFSRPSPASAIMAPMAATANMPLNTPRSTTAGRRSGTPSCPIREIMVSAAADPMHPVTTQFLRLPKRNPVARTPTRTIPRNTPPFWAPEREVDCPGEKPKTRPAKGSRMSSCMK